MRNERTDDERSADERIVRDHVGDDPEILYEDGGWCSRVYLIDRGRVVFKFPRDASAQQEYRDEIAVLRMMERFPTDVVIPTVRWVGHDHSFFGYEGVIGDELTDVAADLDATAKRRIGAAIGTFLKVLHAADLDGARVTTIESEIEEYVHKYELSRATFEDVFTRTEASTIATYFTKQLPTTLRALGGESRLTHGDLGPWNIVVTDTRRVGIIDFGDVGYHDPSKDFSGFGDATILDAAFEAYGADGHLRSKAATRIRAFPVLDIPFYVGTNNAAGVGSCLDRVRRTILATES